MNPSDFEFLATFLHKTSGLSLTEGKEYLLEAKLGPLAQSTGLAGIPDLVKLLRKGNDPQLESAVTESMTTNESSFFRDIHPFEDFKSLLLPELIKERQTTRTLRIWCAACSTGQEPYSLAMLLEDDFPQLKS